MIQVHVVTEANAEFYTGALSEYFACRHKVFVEEMRWNDISSVQGRERDRFDDEHAIYLLLIDDDLGLLGGQRFYPTVRPHMLSEIFPHLSQWPIPQDHATFEATRYCILPAHRAGRADARLLIGMQQFCLDEGIRHLTGVVPVAALTRWLQAGFKLRPLGLPQEIGGEPTIAVLADVTQEGLSRMCSRLGGRATGLVRQGLREHEKAKPFAA